MRRSTNDNGFDSQKVYDLLFTIPQGRVVTYGKLAEMLGNKHLARTVGNILHANPDGDGYPCYKVVNSKGMLSHSYAFGGIEEQKHRLESEGITVKNGKVNLEEYGYQNVPSEINSNIAHSERNGYHCKKPHS